MNGLDCLTPLGLEYMQRQTQIVTRVSTAWGVSPVETPPEEAADVDALFSRDGHLVGIAEVKARNLTMTDLMAFGSYLVTYGKLVKGAKCAEALRVPFVLVVGLWPERHIAVWPVYRPGRGWLVPMRVEDTVTQATCNGGSVRRSNAYLPVGHMRLLRET